MRIKYEVRKVGEAPTWERWLATFRHREDAEMCAFEVEPRVDSVEIVEVWDDA